MAVGVSRQDCFHGPMSPGMSDRERDFECCGAIPEDLLGPGGTPRTLNFSNVVDRNAGGQSNGII